MRVRARLFLGIFAASTGLMGFNVGCGARTDFAELDPVVVGTNEAGADAKVDAKDSGTPDAHVPQGKRCVRNANDPLPVPFQIPPNAPKPAFPRPPQLQFQGGPTLQRATFIPITYDADEYRNDIEDFVASVGCTDYWRAAMNDYGVGDAVSGTPIHLSEAAPQKITNDQIGQWLRKNIESKTFPDLPDVLYAVFYPQDTLVTLDGERSCETFGAYHYEVELTNGTKRAYAVMPRCSGFGNLSDLEELTSSSSHEFVEAASDPFPLTEPGWVEPDLGGYGWGLIAGDENADMCSFEEDSYFQPANYPFTVARSWSNSQVFKGLDPCAPAPTGDYFGGALLLTDQVTIDIGNGPVKATGVKVAVGQTTTVKVRAFGGAGNMTFSAVDYGQALGQGKTLDLSLDKPNGSDGDVLTLTIHRTGSGPYGFTPFAIRASKQGREKHWYAIVGD